VGSGYNKFDKKKGIVCLFRWGFPGINRRIFPRFLMKDIQMIKMEFQEGISPRRVLYMEIKGRQDIPLTRTMRWIKTIIKVLITLKLRSYGLNAIIAITCYISDS